MDEVPFDHKIGAVRLYVTALERSVVEFAASIIKDGHDLKLCNNCLNKIREGISKFRIDLTIKEDTT